MIVIEDSYQIVFKMVDKVFPLYYVQDPDIYTFVYECNY